jgi:hypothetical protein
MWQLAYRQRHDGPYFTISLTNGGIPKTGADTRNRANAILASGGPGRAEPVWSGFASHLSRFVPRAGPCHSG